MGKTTLARNRAMGIIGRGRVEKVEAAGRGDKAMSSLHCNLCGVEMPANTRYGTLFCPVCRPLRKKARMREWREQNQERLSAYHRTYRADHKEATKQTSTKWREANRDQVRQKARTRYHRRMADLKDVNRGELVISMDEAVKQRFRSQIDCSGDCWLWTGPHNEHGYGVFSIGDIRILAHRAAYQLENGAISDELLVCHDCDNPPCCNPLHLFSGTHADNSQDMAAKKRHWKYKYPEKQVRGEQVVTSKLTEDQVRQIRALAKAGVTQYRIAEQFNVSEAHIGKIVLRKAWAHVTDD